MNLSKITKLLIIVATIIPPVYMALFFAGFAYTVTVGPDKAGILFENFWVVMVFHLMVMFLMFVLMVFYIVFLFRTDAVRNEMKPLWAIALFMGGPVAMPIFWYLYVWPGRGPIASGAAG